MLYFELMKMSNQHIFKFEMKDEKTPIIKYI